MVMTLALEGGLVALAAFVALTRPALRLVLLAEREGRSRYGTAIAAYGLFFLLYTPISTNFRLFPGALLLWMLVGFAATLVQRATVQPYRQDEPSASSSASSLSTAPVETSTERELSPAPPRAMSRAMLRYIRR
jgi:hypothetical protein